MNNFLKYYWLEQDYLEKEVQLFFKRNGYLTAEQFFAIVEWKTPKFGKIKLSYLTDVTIKELSKKISKPDVSKEGKMEIVLKDKGKNRKGIRLATASAILTVLYPDDFTVYDIRVRKQLAKHNLWKKIINKKGEMVPENISGDKNEIRCYFDEYVENVRKLGRELSGKELSLRDCDRLLWAKDWHDDLEEFTRNRKNGINENN